MKFSKNTLTEFEINPGYDKLGYEQIIETSPVEILPDDVILSSKDIGNYVDSMFEKDALIISNNTKKIEEAWRNTEKRFIDLSLNIFSMEDIPNEKYVCYPTVCPLIARDPIKHRVAFPYSSSQELACYVIAHELLHEFFYHHLYNMYGNSIDLNSRHIWDLSEVVAVLIMQEIEWYELFLVKAEPYKIHKQLLLDLKLVWYNKKNLDDFLGKYFEKYTKYISFV